MTPGAGIGRVFTRFLISGGLNTVVTYALYLGLLAFVPYIWAYAIAFVVGIFVAYWLNRLFVFRTRGRQSTALLFPLVYAVQLILGAITAAIWVDVLHLPRELAPAAAIAVTMPITFLLSRALFGQVV